MIGGKPPSLFMIDGDQVADHPAVQDRQVVGAEDVVQLAEIEPALEIEMREAGPFRHVHRLKDVTERQFQEGIVFELVQAPDRDPVEVAEHHAIPPVHDRAQLPDLRHALLDAHILPVLRLQVDHEKAQIRHACPQAHPQQIPGKDAPHVPRADQVKAVLLHQGTDEDAPAAVLFMKVAVVAVHQIETVEIGQGFHAAHLAQRHEIEILLQYRLRDRLDFGAVLVGIVDGEIHRHVRFVGKTFKLGQRVFLVQEQIEILRVERRDPEGRFHR